MDSKLEQYKLLLKQVDEITSPELDEYTNISCILSALKYQLDLYWVGIYMVKDKELILGPFQGMNACQRIEMGKGVCGTAAFQKKVQIVPDVSQFQGYIACHSETNSEIVIPSLRNDSVTFVLDADSLEYNHFDETDSIYLSDIVKHIDKYL